MHYCTFIYICIWAGASVWRRISQCANIYMVPEIFVIALACMSVYVSRSFCMYQHFYIIASMNIYIDIAVQLYLRAGTSTDQHNKLTQKP